MADVPEPTWQTDWVEATNTDGRVVLWETHPQHPGGEVFLAPGPPRLAALTPEVALRLRLGLLRLADEPAEVQPEQPWIGLLPPAERPHPPRVKATAARHQPEGSQRLPEPPEGRPEPAAAAGAPAGARQPPQPELTPPEPRRDARR